MNIIVKKMKIKNLAAMLLPLLLLASCNRGLSGEGSVQFSLENQSGVIDIETKSSVGDFTTLPSAADFSITVEDASGNQTVVSDLSAPISLPSGDYTATASYGTLTDEGFDKPCFSGSTTFTVKGGESSTVSIRVSLASCIVKMSFTDNFKNYYPDYNLSLTTGNGTVIPFPKSETRACFMDAYQFSLSGTLVNQAGVSTTIPSKDFKNLQSATCYTLKMDASNIGSNVITISFNDSIVDVTLGEVDINE